MMTSILSDPSSPSAPDEDAACARGGVAVLVDGAGIPRALRAGCVHSVAWYAENLARSLLEALSDPARSPRASLARAIAAVRSLHEHVCDLDRGSPSATVVAVREREGLLEHLVLCDSSLLLRRRDGSVERLTDDRLAQVVAQERSGRAIEARRNRPGGFWVARHEEEAAEQARTGAVPVAELDAAVLVSDGVTRALDELALMDAAELVACAATRQGAVELVARIRREEDRRAAEGSWPLRKVHDDATIVHCALGDPEHRDPKALPKL